MNHRHKNFYFVSASLIILVFLSNGCNDNPQNDMVAETQTRNQKSNEIARINQNALPETPEYKKLKKQIEIDETGLTKLETKRNKLLEEYMEQSVEVREVSIKLEEIRSRLNQLKSLADKESIKTGRKPEYFPF